MGELLRRREIIGNSIKIITIPFLTDTSQKFNNTILSPTINGIDTSYVNQSGTISAINGGTYTVYWDLKYPTKSQWTDGTITQKSASWQILYYWNKYNVVSTVNRTVVEGETYSKTFVYSMDYGGAWGSSVSPQFSSYYSEWKAWPSGITNSGALKNYFYGTFAYNSYPYLQAHGSSTASSQGDAVHIISVSFPTDVQANCQVKDCSVQTSTIYSKGDTLLGVVTSTSNTTYPENGTPDNTNWYVKDW